MAHDTVPHVGATHDKSGQRRRELCDDPDNVILPRKKYEELLEDQRWLRALEAAGVDNWVGFEEAQELLEDWDM